jgi:glycosyltransferase involved in cell wall biosynthesis
MAKLAAKAGLGLDGKRVALFVGALYEPNVEAVSALYDIASKLDRKDVVFVVVGRVGERFRSNERVLVTGGVENVTPYFAAADLAVNPMRSGGGMQVKLLEFLAAGLPTVTTAMGARGTPAMSGRDLVIAPLKDFAEAVRTILEDESMASWLGAGGRGLVEGRYGWPAIAGQRVAVYNRLIALRNGESPSWT